MKLSRRSTRRCRAIVGLLAITWLPYVSTRCIAKADGGCAMLPVSGSGDVHSRSHEDSRGAQEANRAPHHDEHDGSAPRHTCCHLTGKFAFTVASSPPSAAPAVVLVTMPMAAETPAGHLAARLRRLNPEPTQHPPPYLRFVTLLL